MKQTEKILEKSKENLCPTKKAAFKQRSELQQDGLNKLMI